MPVLSFIKSYKKEIKTFFLKEQFFRESKDFSPTVQEGILSIIDSLSDYHEEGRPIFPEIIFITDMFRFQKKLPHLQKIKIGDFNLPVLNINEFEKILKSCAPLSMDGWVIYIEVNQYSSPLRIEYGLINGETNELSETLYNQVFTNPNKIKEEMSCIFLRNIGQKTIQMTGLKDGDLTLAFSANIVNTNPYEEVKNLAEFITKNLPKGKIKNKSINYFVKIIFDALNKGHGSLIGVLETSIASLDRNDGSVFIGHRLETPLNFIALVEKAEKNKSPDDHHALKKNSFIAAAAINNDGITIFSTDGKLLGYHYIIHGSSSKNIAGGARSQAFEAMKNSGKFICCFYKSQDGKTKLWIKK